MNLRKCFEFTGAEPFFQGHFPGMPVLPGVMQLELAHRTVEETVGHGLVLKGVKKMKFVHVVVPGRVLELELSGDPDGGEVSYRFRMGDEACSSGVLQY